jgi:hypothetical protein
LGCVLVSSPFDRGSDTDGVCAGARVSVVASVFVFTVSTDALVSSAFSPAVPL